MKDLAPCSAGDPLERELEQRLDGVVPEEHARAIASGAALFCRGMGYDRSIPDDYMDALLCKALAVAGHERAAEDWAVRRGLPPERALAARLWDRALPPEAWRLLVAGFVRPARWAVATGGVLIALDFARLTDARVQTELEAYTLLRGAIDGLAPLWSSVKGRGALGLKAVNRLRVVGRSDALRFSADALERLAAERGWSPAPAVLCLDAPSAAGSE